MRDLYRARSGGINGIYLLQVRVFDNINYTRSLGRASRIVHRTQGRLTLPDLNPPSAAKDETGAAAAGRVNNARENERSGNKFYTVLCFSARFLPPSDVPFRVFRK